MAKRTRRLLRFQEEIANKLNRRFGFYLQRGLSDYVGQSGAPPINAVHFCIFYSLFSFPSFTLHTHRCNKRAAVVLCSFRFVSLSLCTPSLSFYSRCALNETTKMKQLTHTPEHIDDTNNCLFCF
jgi:hypothetical protein